MDWYHENVPVESFLHYFLVNADSNIETILELHQKGYEVERFSGILRQSSKVTKLGIRLTESSSSHMAKLVRALCQCSHLKSVSISIDEFDKIPPEQFMKNLMALIQCGHLEDIYYEFHIDGEGYCSMASDEAKTLNLARTQKIVDAIEGNRNLVGLSLHSAGSYNAPKYFDLDKIDSLMETRQSNS